MGESERESDSAAVGMLRMCPPASISFCLLERWQDKQENNGTEYHRKVMVEERKKRTTVVSS